MAKPEPAFPDDSEDEPALWELWLVQQDAATRNRLFFFYSPWSRVLASYMLSRYPHPLAEWSDYVNFASIGLLQAIDGFDPLRKARFKTYAEPYIKGGVLKGLSCYVKDRRSVSYDRLASIASEQEVEAGGTDFDTVVGAVVDLAFGYFLELGIVDQEPVDNNPLRVYEQASDTGSLGRMIERLPATEQKIILGHYYQHLSFVELSQLLGLTKSRVSQLHAQALKRVRGYYEALGELDSNW